MCVQPQLPVSKQEDTALWFTIERPLSYIHVQAEGLDMISGQDIPEDLHVISGRNIPEGPDYDPMARWMNESPADTPWHRVRECRLASEPALAKPKHASVQSVPSSTGATACIEEHGAGVR